MKHNLLNTNFWQNKIVLVTGHTGFKGSWLALWLKLLGAKIIGYSLPPVSSHSMFEQCNIANDIVSIFGDIRDQEKLTETFKKYSPEIVFHLAAQPLVLASYDDPVNTYSTNVMGTLNIFEAARNCEQTQVIINVTSDKCYENKEWLWAYREDEHLGGHDPYSSSKACAEILTSSYRRSYFNNNSTVALCSARAGNCIGGGDWSENRLIPDAIRSFLENQPVTIRSPYSTRPWQHVLEPLNGYLLLAQHASSNKIAFSEAWNFGPDLDSCKTVAEVMSLLKIILGNKFKYNIDTDMQIKHEATFLRVDNSKARQRLDWHPQLKLKESLQLTADWYIHYQNNQLMEQFSLQQIKAFTAMMQNTAEKCISTESLIS